MSSQHILITGAAGFIGQGLAAALINTSSDTNLTLVDLTKPPIPRSVAQYADRIETKDGDLTDPAVINGMFKTQYTTVYLLHGLMSGGSEANLELGWRVNWDSHRAILDCICLHHPKTVIVFPSSLAVYGPTTSAQDVTSETTCPQPQSSYGAQKHMVETYLNDMSRRGLLDGRIARLPTIIVRPGVPSAAASSFASAIVREPLKGEETVLPVSRDLEMWVCSGETVIKNLIAVKDIPAEKFGLDRVVNLPGITVKIQQILDALEAVGGKEALALIKEQRDPKIEAIVGSWPARFDTRLAEDLGLAADFDLVQNVKAFSKLAKE